MIEDRWLWCDACGLLQPGTADYRAHVKTDLFLNDLRVVEDDEAVVMLLEGKTTPW